MQRLLCLILGTTLAAAAAAYVIYDAWAWDRAAKIVDSGFRQLGAAQNIQRPGGIFLDNDSYYWLNYARRIGDRETWRVRYTPTDNAPYGRPVHWSQSVSWLLFVMGKMRQALTSESWMVALEQASIWMNPLLLIFLICGMGWILFRRIGAIAAGLFMVNFVTLGDLGWTFQPLRPGHQSLYCFFGILTLAGIVFGGAGWIRVNKNGEGTATKRSTVKSLEIPDFRGAKRWFLISGAFAVLGLWVSAVVTFMLLAMLFGAGLWLAYCAPELANQGEVQIKPELWRWWGWIGGAGSLFFYLLEYFPDHLSLLRLEVNGPLYSIAVVAMGEALCQFLRARYRQGDATVSLVKALLFTAVVLLVPCAIFFGPQSWHALRDPQMFRLHHFIEEFFSMARFAGPGFIAIFFRNCGILPLFLVLAIGLTTFSNVRLQEWAVIWLSFAITFGMLVLSYLQIRWLGMFAAVNALLAVVTMVCLWRLSRERLPVGARPLVGGVLALALIIQPFLFAKRRYHQVDDIIEQRTVPTNLANPVLNKRLALALREAEGPATRVMAEPNLAPALHYFGEAAAVASFYWENLDGLHAATAFLADSKSGDIARQVALERGLTHVALQEGDRLQNYFYFYATGKMELDAAKQTFAARLMGSEFMLPDWLQSTPALQQMGSQVYTYRGMRFEDRFRIYRIKVK